MSPEISLKSRRRAGEHARHYLLSEFSSTTMEAGARLPSIKALSKHLKVSTGTVQGVLRDLAAEGLIRTRRGSGTYLLAQPPRKVTTLRALVSMPLSRLHGGNGWMERIGGGMFNAALQARPSLSLEGVAARNLGRDAIIDELMSRRDAVDGLILMPYSLLRRHYFVIDAYEAAGKPVINLQAPELTATANFVSADYFQTARSTARVWSESGRRRIALLQVEPGSLHHSVVQFFHFGLLAGLDDAAGGGVVCIDGGRDWSANAAGDAVKRYLAGAKEAPDAVFCENDTSAMGVIRALEEAGFDVPDEVSVVAGTDTGPEYAGISRFSQPLGQIGSTAVELLLRRIALQREFAQNVSFPGVMLPFHFLPGKTTRPEENALFRSLLDEPKKQTPQYE